MESENNLALQGFELPSQATTRGLWVRGIVDSSHLRTFEPWWALYDGGRRRDGWPLPDRTGIKLLASYRLCDVSSPGKERAVFRICGKMFRFRGAWWVMEKEWTLTVARGAITFQRDQGVFSLSHGYNTGDEGASSASSRNRRLEAVSSVAR